MSIFQNDTYMQEKLNTLNEKLTVLRNNMFESDGEERVKYESEYSSLLSEYLKMIGEMRDKNAARRKSPEELRHFMEWLEENRKNEISISFQPASEPMVPALSKIGGHPTAPEQFEWPYCYVEEMVGGYSWKDNQLVPGEIVTVKKTLTFLMQVNLKDLASLDEEGMLPERGILLFFYETDTQPWGPELGEGFSVIYVEDESKAEECAFPDDLSEENRLPEYRLQFSKDKSFMSFYELAAPERDIPEEAGSWNEFEDSCYDDYDEVITALTGKSIERLEGNITKMLGFADVVQNPMQEQCEREYQEKYPEETKKEKSAEEYKGAEQDWVLLLQLGTIEDEESNNCLMWGDGGYLYFWIRRDDLAARRFDRTVMVLQCG